MTILDKVNSPEDLKALPSSELTELAGDIRKALLHKVSNIGGHVGPNLGVVEMTVALHKVFESPKDKFVWDVSHQTYPHKIITGRKHGFTDGHFHDITPYTSPEESEHDFFTVGHTSTSIANAMGLAQARDMQGEKGNVIAIIGDGSISGGLAMEALNNAGDFKGNLIIILNDNQMSIAENQGGIYRKFEELRENNGEAEDNFFKSFGLDYHYLGEGNDVDKLIEFFEKVKDTNRPVVLHIKTEKGHGYQPAIENKEAFHWHSPFDLETGKGKNQSSGQRGYTDVIHEVMENKVAEGLPILAINAAVPGLFNLKAFADKYPERYYDAGIAEQFTITFGGAMAAGGARPIIFQNSSFMQRAYDQMLHDLAVNENPALVLVRGAVISSSDTTHQGSFAMTWISNIPNLVYLAPTSEEDLQAMMNWALEQSDHPVVIQIPEHGLENRPIALSEFKKPSYQILQEGSQVAILGLGGLYSHTEKVAEALEASNVHATLVNPLFISELDEATLLDLAKNHKLIATFEDGVLDGGFGQKVASFLGKHDVRVLNFGANKEFNEQVPVDELYDRYRMSVDKAKTDIMSILSE